MNRRTFTQVLGAAALSAALPEPPAVAESAKLPPYSLSVMLWTVLTKLPIEQRLEKIAEAGYNQVQLVGEYHKDNWSDADYARVIAACKRLKINFDCTAGLPHGIADPNARGAFLADLSSAFKPMETLSIPAIIVLSGNVVPGRTRAEQHECCIETLKRAAALVEGKQIAGQPVRIFLETIDPEENPKYFLTTMAEAFDVVHEQVAEGNLIEKIEKNIDLIGLLHVADVPGRHQPGTGEINFTNIYRKLALLNYKHTIAMEFMPTGDTVSALRKAKELALSAGAV
jgi:hydroxypyruvate isomerase